MLENYTVREVPHGVAAGLITSLHYSRGCANTSVGSHALFLGAEVVGAVLWMPPSAGAAKYGSRVGCCEARNVLTLSRMVLRDSVPKNGASYLLARSRRLLPRRWELAITYADPMEGHDGHVYVAAGWLRAGASGASTRWTDPDGRMRSRVCAGGLSVAEMERRGWTRERCPPKPRFVYPLSKRVRKALTRNL